MARVEWLRKLAHVSGGIAPPVAVALFGWAGAYAVALFLAAHILVAWDLERRGVLLPIIGAALRRTRREREPFPLGAAEYAGAVLLLGLLFPLPYFFGAVALLGVGDGAATLAGQRWGRRRLPWNPDKSWAGLAAGAGAGTAAFVAFAVVGGQMQARGDAAVAALTGPCATWPALAFLLAGYPVVVGAARLAVRNQWAEASANASPVQVVTAFAASLAPAVAFLLVAPLALHGPVFPTLGGHGAAARAALVAVPAAVMGVESLVRRHDNLWVAGLGAALAYGVVGLLRQVG